MQIKRAVEILFILGLFFFPFNQYEGIPVLGEFSSEAAVVFFIPAFILVIAYSLIAQKIYFPINNKLYKIVIVLLIWCVIGLLFNFHEIILYYFKRTKGISRFIRQFFSLLLSCVIFFQVYWFVLKDKTAGEILLLIRKVFLSSLIVVSVYGFIEILISFFGFSFLMPIMDFFSYLPFLEPRVHLEGRIAGVAYEPPFLAIYLISIAGWMFSYIISGTGYKKYLPAIAIIILTFFSGSRTALIVVTIQFLLFLYVLYVTFNQRKIVLNFIKYSFVVILTIGVFSGYKFYNAVSEKIESLDFLGNLKKNPSNKSRLGIQYTSMIIFAENPITGVGFGQQAYEARGRYPYWSTVNNYEYEIYYKNQKEESFPPGYNIYTRLLAELGLVGFLIFIYLQFSMLRTAKRLIKFQDKDSKLLGLAIYISLVGLFINWLQIDSFRIYGVWISLAILICVGKKQESNG